MSLFDQKELERLKQDHKYRENERTELSERISALKSDFNYEADSSNRIKLEREIRKSKSHLTELDNELKELEHKISSLEEKNQPDKQPDNQEEKETESTYAQQHKVEALSVVNEEEKQTGNSSQLF